MNFIPYGKQSIDTDDINEVCEVLKSDFLTTGPKVKEFEEKISEFCGSKYCIAVSNGTAALHLASLVLTEESDKVLTTPNSFLATSNAILYAKAKPIFVDICEDGNIDLDLCEEYLKNDDKIKAIYTVHFSGNPVNQDKLKYLKEKYNIKILEDCAHSLGASFDNIKAGSCINSDISIFSFHPVKNMTTGEGGAITTNSKEIYEKLLSLRNHGMIKTKDMRPWEYEMQDLGFNYRITDIQSALGLSQLKKLNSFIEKRQELAKRYDKKFEGSCVKPLYSFTKNSSYHIYVVKVDLLEDQDIKEKFFNTLREENIGIQLHYLPINKQSFYKKLGYGTEYTPIMNEYYKKAFSLPLYPSLSDEEQDYVVKKVFEVLDELS